MANYFQGKRVVVTGRMHKTRAQIEAELTKAGAYVQRAVSGNTDLLICGADVGERKTRAAEALKVAMIHRDQYRELIEGKHYEAAPAKVKVSMTHEEFVASLPESYGEW